MNYPGQRRVAGKDITVATEPTRSDALYPFERPRQHLTSPLGIALLGATGSIGRQAVDLVCRYPDRFRLESVAIHSRVAALADLLEKLNSSCPTAAPLVAVVDPAARAEAATLPELKDCLLAAGERGLCEAATLDVVDCVVNGVVGAAGLAPTLAAARAGKRIALANKESLVVGGELVHAAVSEGGGEILPVDSEHSAIAQCLSGCRADEMESIILTASGGPFRTLSRQEMKTVTPARALQHPTWQMGPKITIDSATLMNKGLEVIEAHHLFGLPYEHIEVVIHPGSVVHSLVVFQDGALLAQLGSPDMHVPLLYAMSGEKHWPLGGKRLDLLAMRSLQFEAPDLDRFPCLRLARQAGEAGGWAPIVLNAANEVAVAGFLAGNLTYVDIPAVIENCLSSLTGDRVSNLGEALAIDRQARDAAGSLIAGRASG
jgi:1-deoxy-D-xylulose-5-phosphate reductoisomerase